MRWRCRICGYDFGEATAPQVCEVCGSSPRDFRQYMDVANVVQINYADQFIGSHGLVDVNCFLTNLRNILIFVVHMPVGGKIRLHRHPGSDELCYVIKGHITFTIGEAKIEAHDGDIIQVATSVLHSWWNAGDSEAIVLRVQSPTPVLTQYTL